MTNSASRSERGTVLITTLFIVMAMAVAAVAATDALERSLATTKRSERLTEQAWMARSAAAGIEAMLQSRKDMLPTWLKEPVNVPTLTGNTQVELRDTSNCFNLNSIALNTTPADTDQNAIAVYEKLLAALGTTETDAERLANSLADWIDVDSTSRSGGAEDPVYVNRPVPSHTANKPLLSVLDLRAVDGYGPDVLQRISDRTCAGDAGTTSAININALTRSDAPLLFALGNGAVSIETVQSVIDSRPVGGWLSVEEFLASFPKDAEGAAPVFFASFGTTPRVIEARFSLPDSIAPVTYIAQFRASDGEIWSLKSIRRSLDND